MSKDHEPRIDLGIVGGMGPLASAEFVRTVYEYGLGEREQLSPTVLLYSDPTFPDRTDAFMSGNDGPLREKLIDVITRLDRLGVEKVLICCMTIHYLVPRLPEALRSKIISPLDEIFESVEQSPKESLLICSTGTRKLNLFESHPKWTKLGQRILLPSEKDQESIHRDLIYPMKLNPELSDSFPVLDSVLKRYKVDSFIAGCSEIHMLAKSFLASKEYGAFYSCIDPFATIARRVSEEKR
jgi:aspartate racemase